MNPPASPSLADFYPSADKFFHNNLPTGLTYDDIFDSVTVSMSDEMIGICSFSASEIRVARTVWRGNTSE